MAKAKRTEAQKRATRKMIAANRARARAAASPKPRKRPAARKAAAPRAASRPAKRSSGRRGRGGWVITSAPAASRAGRALRHRRPNPVGGFFKDTLMPSVVGGAGALALDVALGVLPIPPALKTGPAAPLVRIAGAVGLGMLAGKMVNRRVGEQVAAGGITVAVYNLARTFLVGKVPGLSMYPDGAMGEYIDYTPPQLGYESSGVGVGDPDLQGYETGVYR